jgi:hypothetical protein
MNISKVMTSIKNKSENIPTEFTPEKILSRAIANYQKTKNTDPCVAAYLVKNKAELAKNIKPLIPNNNQSTFTFHLMNSNTQMANAFRRVLSSEMEFRYFDCTDPMDIDTDDPKLARTREYIIQRINSISIDQEVAEKLDREKVSKIQYVLEDENLDQNTVSYFDKVVTSASINLYEMVNDKWKKNDNNQKYFAFCQTVRLVHLKKAKKIRVKIFLNIDDSFDNHTISRGSYTYIPLEFKEPYPQSYTVHPKNYELSITNNRFTKCKWYTNKIFVSIKDRLESVLKDFVAASKESNIPYTSKKLRIEKLAGGEDKFKYKVFEETQTIGNIIAWYTYKMDETIDLCNCGNDHPKDPYIVLNIIHKDHINHFVKGIQKAIDDTKRIISQI